MDKFQAAILNKDWDTVESMVCSFLTSFEASEGETSLRDWLEEGDYDGNESPASVAQEWVELCAEADRIRFEDEL